MKNGLHNVKYISGIPIGEMSETQQKCWDYGSGTAESPEEKQTRRGQYLLMRLHISFQGTAWCSKTPFTTPAGQQPCLLSQQLQHFSELPIILLFTPKTLSFLHKYLWSFSATAVFGTINGWTQDKKSVFIVPFSGKGVKLNTDGDLN